MTPEASWRVALPPLKIFKSKHLNLIAAQKVVCSVICWLIYSVVYSIISSDVGTNVGRHKSKEPHWQSVWPVFVFVWPVLHISSGCLVSCSYIACWVCSLLMQLYSRILYQVAEVTRWYFISSKCANIIFHLSIYFLSFELLSLYSASHNVLL